MRQDPTSPDAPTLERAPLTNVCALCAKPRAEVTRLVAGAHGAVCDACIGEALASLDTEGPPGGPRRYAQLAGAITAILGALSPHTPLAESTPLFHAALALATGDADALRALVPFTSTLGQYAIVLEIFARIPPEERTFGDLVDRADALYYLDRPREALDELDAVDEGTLPDDERAALWALRAAALSRMPWPDLEQTEPALRCVEAVIEGSEAAATLEEAFRSMIALAQIRVFVARSKPELALPWFAHLDPNFAEAQLVMGEVYAALGRHDEGTACFGRALASAHPESALAAAARARLGR
jgi:tetratricopeptide (TPR) repeat protein